MFENGDSILCDPTLANVIRFQADGSSISLTTKSSRLGWSQYRQFENVVTPIFSSPVFPTLATYPEQSEIIVSLRTHLRATNWTISNYSSNSVVMDGDVGNQILCQLTLNVSTLTYKAIFPVHQPGERDIQINTNSAYVMHKHRLMTIFGSIFVPPRPFLIQPLLMSIDTVLTVQGSSSNSNLFALLSLTRDKLTYQFSNLNPSSIVMPSFASDTPIVDFSSNVSPSVKCPSMTAVVSCEVWPEVDVTIFTPINDGVAHIVIGNSALTSTDGNGDFWNLIKPDYYQVIKISSAFPPNGTCNNPNEGIDCS